RYWLEAQVMDNEPEAAAAGQEAAHDGPGHRRRLRQDLGEVVAAPDGAPRFGPRRQRRDLLAPHLFALPLAGRTCFVQLADRPRLQQVEAALRQGPLDVARRLEIPLDAQAEPGEFLHLAVAQRGGVARPRLSSAVGGEG